jgi:hypothetical protein
MAKINMLINIIAVAFEVWAAETKSNLYSLLKNKEKLLEAKIKQLNINDNPLIREEIRVIGVEIINLKNTLTLFKGARPNAPKQLYKQLQDYNPYGKPYTTAISIVAEGFKKQINEQKSIESYFNVFIEDNLPPTDPAGGVEKYGL